MSKRVKTETSQPTVCVQLIQTEWSKDSRGGDSAGKRNQVPEAVELPPANDSQNNISALVHTVVYLEKRGFDVPASAEVELKDTNLLRLNGLRIERIEGMVKVVYQYDGSYGMPHRYSKQQNALTLCPEQWGRVRYNGRFSGYSTDWYYRKCVWNIGWFIHPKPDAFLSTDPVHTFSQMAHLF